MTYRGQKSPNVGTPGGTAYSSTIGGNVGNGLNAFVSTPEAATAVQANFGGDKAYLNASSAGTTGVWISYVPGMRFGYALDSGSTTTTFSIDISADGVTSLGQAFTGTWASSTLAELTPPIYLTNPLARFVRFNVLTGGPLSVSAYI